MTKVKKFKNIKESLKNGISRNNEKTCKNSWTCGETNMKEHLMKLKKLQSENRAEFYKTFEVTLETFWETLTGFDIIKFVEFIKTPDGISASDWTTEKYGENADKLIERLIS